MLHSFSLLCCSYYFKRVVLLLGLLYSDEGQSIVVETSIKSYCAHLVGIEETIMTLHDK